ncbi:4-alpha-glucanotransferase, partial [Klebsiella pneumoniae]
MAVGVAAGGSETCCDRELYCLKASVGAPPDILGPLGQNWGLPPLDPPIIAARASEPFLDLPRANMQNCGPVRIGQVMSGLARGLIPHGESTAHGST